MTTLRQIRAVMQSYTDRPPMEHDSEVWRDFVHEAENYLGTSPLADTAGGIEVEPEYASFWSDVAAGRSPEYDSATGARRDS
jgi:hypothetical protein